MGNHTFGRCLRFCAAFTLLLLFIGTSHAVQSSPDLQDSLTLVYGQSTEGRIEAGQPSVVYEFSAQTGDVITISMITAAGDLDPFIILSTNDRVPIATDDNSGGGLNARLTYVIPQSGLYLIQATHAGGVPPEAGGTFALSLSEAADESTDIVPMGATTPDDAAAIQGDSIRLSAVTAGTPIRESLSREVPLRYYWFTAGQGDQIIVSPDQVGTFEPLYVLYDASFTELARSEPAAPMRHGMADDGVFLLAVALPDRDSSGGPYSFTVDRIPNPATSGNFIDIAYGESQRGNIDTSVSAIAYRFTGFAGDGVVITMSRAGGDLDSYLYLLDATGQLLFEDNDSGGNNGDARLVYTLPDDGTYLVIATRLGQTQGLTGGSFILELQSDGTPPALVNTPETTLPTEYASLPQIAYGDTVEGELSDAKFMEFYIFLGAEGDSIIIEMDSPSVEQPGGLDPFLVLLDADRIPLAENDDVLEGVQRNARIELTLPRSGYYAIVATRFDQENGTTSGFYTLTLSGPGGSATIPHSSVDSLPLAERLSTITLTTDTPLEGSFRAAAQFFKFSADTTEQVDISVNTTPDVEAVLILADADLREVVSSNTGGLVDVILSGPGQYLLLASPRFGPWEAPGASYTITFSRDSVVGTRDFSGPQAIGFGDIIEAAIDDDSPSQIFTFAGLAGQRVRISMEALAGSGLDCYLELRDAEQAVVAANDDIQAGVVRDSQIVTDLPVDGTYTIIASRYAGPEDDPTSGGFRLTFELVDENTVAGISSTTTPIAYGQTEVDEINDSQYLIFYVFDGTVGDVVTIEVSHLTGNLDSVLHLYRSDGSGWVEIANDDDSPTGGTYAPLLSDVVLPQTGKYLIAIHRYGMERETSFGTFALTLSRLE